MTRGHGFSLAALLGAAALAAVGTPAVAGDTVQRGSVPTAAPVGVPDRLALEMVYFRDRRQKPVRLLRGAGLAADGAAHTLQREIVSFGTGRAEQVVVVRGTIGPALPSRQAALGQPAHIEKISFGDPQRSRVVVVRGAASGSPFAIDLFGPARGGELDRIAFAVDGAESRHGADPRMWRPEPDGPQGPMQVSAAAAIDVGGGDRFDLRQNRLLGRAYLAQMFRRYGNWPDALAAYNWGPANVDEWIASGRDFGRLPLETLQYLERVLRDALITSAARL